MSIISQPSTNQNACPLDRETSMTSGRTWITIENTLEQGPGGTDIFLNGSRNTQFFLCIKLNTAQALLLAV